MSKEPELKPCPFCGVPPVINRLMGDYGYTPDTIEIRCENVECKIQPRRKEAAEAYTRRRGTYSIANKVIKESIEAWNTRTTDSDTALIGELVEALEQCRDQFIEIMDGEISSFTRRSGAQEDHPDKLGAAMVDLLETEKTKAIEGFAELLTRARKRTGGK